jgi:hypothetical protein
VINIPNLPPDWQYLGVCSQVLLSGFALRFCSQVLLSGFAGADFAGAYFTGAYFPSPISKSYVISGFTLAARPGCSNAGWISHPALGVTRTAQQGSQITTRSKRLSNPATGWRAF